MTDDELKKRLESVPKNERSCSYSIWPYGPEEYKGQRFGSLPDSFLKWIVSNLSSSENDRKQLLAQRAKEEISLRDKLIGKAFCYKRSKGFLPLRRAVIKPISSEDAFVKPDQPISPSATDFLTEEDAAPVKKGKKPAIQPELPKPKKHGIEL